jgi:hypothetical protein
MMQATRSIALETEAARLLIDARRHARLLALLHASCEHLLATDHTIRAYSHVSIETQDLQAIIDAVEDAKIAARTMQEKAQRMYDATDSDLIETEMVYATPSMCAS